MRQCTNEQRAAYLIGGSFIIKIDKIKRRD